MTIASLHAGIRTFWPPLTIVVGIVFVLIAVWVLIGRTGKGLKRATHRNVAEMVSGQLRSGAFQVDMAHTGNFAWDEMFVFGPYYPKNEICTRLKVPSSQCSAAGFEDVGEGEFLLVFMRGNAISDTAKLPRAIANFGNTERYLAKPIRRSAAMFKVERRPAVYLICQ